MWNLLHDSLPTFLTLKNRGIAISSHCPLCDVEDESSSHLFLYYPFTRACWHGSHLAIHTFNLNNIPVQQSINGVVLRYKKMDKDTVSYLQHIFTTLWTMWNIGTKLSMKEDSLTPWMLY